jgi:hypothetical protein
MHTWHITYSHDVLTFLSLCVQFYLSSTPGKHTSALVLGGVNQKYFKGEITYHKFNPLQVGCT